MFIVDQYTYATSYSNCIENKSTIKKSGKKYEYFIK